MNKSYHLMLLHLLVFILLFCVACSEVTSVGSSSIHLNIPNHPVISRFDLSARQGLRDIAGDFAVGKGGADTGLTVFPSEKVEIFASGTASTQAGGKQFGPAGVPGCAGLTPPEPSLICYSVIYSIGISGRAGEVGSHVDIHPTTIGNIFLGVNAPNLGSNAGLFHITVLIIPSGLLAGLWAAPEDGFTFQGTKMMLSAHVFAQDATIDTVQFTATVPGQAAVPICDAVLSGEDTYSCEWRLTLHGNYLRNGPVTLGFILHSSLTRGMQLDPAVNPDGTRTGIIRYVFTQHNDIYAGYAATDFAQFTGYQKVTGRWTVPQAYCSAGETSLSAIWVGITSDASDQSLLAQLGTASGCQDGVPQYYMWWEMFPDPSVPLDAPLQPGDSVMASVTFQHGTFQVTLDNPKERVHFSTRHPGNVSDTSVAECIAEAPTIIDDLATNQGHVAELTNFGKVSILCQLNDNQPIAAGPQDIIYQMETNAGISKATTSQLDQAGSRFTVQWHHA